MKVFFLSIYHVSSAMIISLCFDKKQAAKLCNLLMPVEMFTRISKFETHMSHPYFEAYLVLLKFA